MRRKRTSPIKVKIVSQGLYQADVADAAGICESRLSRIVNHRVEPFDDELARLARVLGVSKQELV